MSSDFNSENPYPSKLIEENQNNYFGAFNQTNKNESPIQKYYNSKLCFSYYDETPIKNKKQTTSSSQFKNRKIFLTPQSFNTDNDILQLKQNQPYNTLYQKQMIERQNKNNHNLFNECENLFDDFSLRKEVITPQQNRFDANNLPQSQTQWYAQLPMHLNQQQNQKLTNISFDCTKVENEDKQQEFIDYKNENQITSQQSSVSKYLNKYTQQYKYSPDSRLESYSDSFENMKIQNNQYRVIENMNYQNNQINQLIIKCQNKFNESKNNQKDNIINISNFEQNIQMINKTNVDLRVKNQEKEEIYKFEEGQRLYSRFEKVNQQIMNKDLGNISQLGQQDQFEFAKNKLIGQFFNYNDMMKQDVKVPFEIFEKIQLNLQEDIFQNTVNLDELDANEYQDLNMSFESIDSDTEQQEQTFKNIIQSQIPILKFYEDIRSVINLFPKFFIDPILNEQSQLQNGILNLNRQLNLIQSKQLIQNEAIIQIVQNFSKLNIQDNSKVRKAHSFNFNENINSLDSIQKRVFQCKFCRKTFPKSCSLGGHISKMHKGKSVNYKEKQKMRENRKTERMRKTYFKQKGQHFNDENLLIKCEEQEQRHIYINQLNDNNYAQIEYENKDFQDEKLLTIERESKNQIEEIYNLDIEDEEEESNRNNNLIITKKISKDKKKNSIQLKNKNNENVSKILFQDNNQQQIDSFYEANSSLFKKLFY